MKENERTIEGLDDEDIIIQKYKDTQKRMVSQKLDFYIPSLKDMLNNKIDLEPKFQRRDRWNRKQQSKLIESIIMGIPIPPIFLAEEEYDKYSVMDGKQRLMAINKYLNNEYALMGLTYWGELNGLKFTELNSTIQNAVTRRYISAVVILKESDLDIKFDIFERINTGGEHLNPQEVRNCIYGGKFNDLLIELSKNKSFRNSLGIPESDEEAKKIKIYQSMDDVELVLRFFILQDYEKISGNLKTSMNKYMEKGLKFTEEELEKSRSLFIRTIEKVYSVYENKCFMKWDPKEKDWLTVSAPLYDAVMYAFSKVDRDSINGKESKILEETKKLFENNEFVDSIRKGTNSFEANKTRIQIFSQMLKSTTE